MENKDFNQVIIETLALQLVRGYEYTSSGGYIQVKESPLQEMVRQELNHHKDFFIGEVVKLLGSDNIKKVVGEYIQSELKSRWGAEAYQEKFIKYFKEVISDKVAEDLRVLLKDKRLVITLEENKKDLPNTTNL